MTLPALIACDVDGTLIDDEERISPRTRSAVRAAVAAGAEFRARHRPAAAVGASRCRGVGIRADRGVRQRCRHLRFGD